MQQESNMMQRFLRGCAAYSRNKTIFPHNAFEVVVFLRFVQCSAVYYIKQFTCQKTQLPEHVSADFGSKKPLFLKILFVIWYFQRWHRECYNCISIQDLQSRNRGLIKSCILPRASSDENITCEVAKTLICQSV